MAGGRRGERRGRACVFLIIISFLVWFYNLQSLSVPSNLSQRITHSAPWPPPCGPGRAPVRTPGACVARACRRPRAQGLIQTRPARQGQPPPHPTGGRLPHCLRAGGGGGGGRGWGGEGRLRQRLEEASPPQPPSRPPRAAAPVARSRQSPAQPPAPRAGPARPRCRCAQRRRSRCRRGQPRGATTREREHVLRRPGFQTSHSRRHGRQHPAIPSPGRPHRPAGRRGERRGPAGGGTAAAARPRPQPRRGRTGWRAGTRW